TQNILQTQFRLMYALKLSQIPIEYFNANLYHYKRNSDNEAVYERLKPHLENIVASIDKGTNFFFYGGATGTGKTFHGAMVLNHFIYKTCVTSRMDFETPLGLFVSYPEWVDTLRLRYRGEDDENRQFEHIKQVPLLLLDDVGAGKLSDYAREQTYMLLNHRCNNRLSTIITSNYGLNELSLADMLGSRSVSRISKNVVGGELSGTDRRLEAW
ncbi:ATP-binding protein, partial [Brevibacillus borstelensis]|uniref:ATP-binding protein n=1 Tax=Brevibacillus borstelensis TaxID=45462 RepID=UPI000689C678